MLVIISFDFPEPACTTIYNRKLLSSLIRIFSLRKMTGITYVDKAAQSPHWKALSRLFSKLEMKFYRNTTNMYKSLFQSPNLQFYSIQIFLLHFRNACQSTDIPKIPVITFIKIHQFFSLLKYPKWSAG